MTRALLTSAILLVSVTASAQQDVFIQDDGTGGQQDQQYEDPQYQDQQYEDPQYQDQQYQPEPQAAQQPAEVERGARQTGIYLTVPIFLTNPTDALDDRQNWDPGFGIGIGGRFGWEFGMIVPEIHIGVQTNISNAVSPTEGPISRLTAFHFSLGARIQFLNPSRFLPFVAVAFRGNFWGYVTEDGFGGSVEYDFNPAASGTVGLAIELSQTIGLEAAVDVVANFGLALSDQSVIGGTDLMLIPRLGGTLYF